MKLHTWNIQFIGQRQYIAPDLDTARKMATEIKGDLGNPGMIEKMKRTSAAI